MQFHKGFLLRCNPRNDIFLTRSISTGINASQSGSSR